MLRYEEILAQMGKSIAIYPLTVESIQGSSVDLLAGEYAWSTVTKMSVVIRSAEGNVLKIAPNDVVIVYSHEVVSVDSTIAGTIHSKIIWTTHGIFMNSTNLDPGYTGNFMFTLYNRSNKEVLLQCGKTPIATLVFYYIGGRTKFQMKAKTLQLRALNSIDIVPDSSEAADLDDQWRNSYEDVREKLKGSEEFSRLQAMKASSPKAKLISVFKRWLIPAILIAIIIIVYLSNLPESIKAAIPSVIALIALIKGSSIDKRR